MSSAAERPGDRKTHWGKHMLGWQDFALSVPLGEILVRGSVTFLGVLLLLRVVGQRESGSIGITDVLIVVLVADAASPGLQGQASSIADSAVLAATVLFWSVVTDAVAYRFPRLAHLVKTRPKPLIDRGELNRRVMRRELMTREEVLAQLRLHGVEDIALVERAYIEPNGMISVVSHRGKGPEEPSRDR